MESIFFINEQILETNLEEQYLVAQKIVFERFLQNSGIPKVNISKKMLSYVRQPRHFPKAVEAKNNERQTSGGKRRK